MASFLSSFTFIQTLLIMMVTGDQFKEYEETLYMQDKLLKYNVIEDVLLSKLPQKVLKVKIGNKSLRPGDVVSPQSMVSLPSVTPSDCDAYLAKQYGHEYSIVMVDPDAPGTKQGYQRLHWLVVGIPGCDVSEGVQVADYRPPMPSPGSGLHRLVFCQYVRAPSYYEYLFWDYFNVFSYQRKITDRQNFSLAKYVRDEKYGVPYACNLALVQNDADRRAKDANVRT